MVNGNAQWNSLQDEVFRGRAVRAGENTRGAPATMANNKTSQRAEVERETQGERETARYQIESNANETIKWHFLFQTCASSLFSILWFARTRKQAYVSLILSL